MKIENEERQNTVKECSFEWNNKNEERKIKWDEELLIMRENKETKENISENIQRKKLNSINGHWKIGKRGSPRQTACKQYTLRQINFMIIIFHDY